MLMLSLEVPREFQSIKVGRFNECVQLGVDLLPGSHSNLSCCFASLCYIYNKAPTHWMKVKLTL